MEFSDSILVLVACGYFTVSVVGSIGNIIAVAAIVSSQKKLSPTSLLVMNISLSLIPMCLFTLPFITVISIQALMHRKLTVTEDLFKGIFVFTSICNQVELNTIAVLAFNRVCAVSCQDLYKRVDTRPFVRNLLVFIWIYSILIWVPVACGVFGQLKITMGDFFVEVVDEQNYRIAISLFFWFILPFLWTFIAHVILLVQFQKHRKTKDQKRSIKAPWQNHITRTLTTIFAILIICTVPHITYHVMQRFGSYPVMSALCHLLYFSRVCVDPFVYMLSSRVYRDACKNVVSCIISVIFMKPVTQENQNSEEPCRSYIRTSDLD